MSDRLTATEAYHSPGPARLLADAQQASQPEVWVIWAGNPGQFPYYAGVRRPLSACWEDGRQFPSEQAANDWIMAHGCAGGWTPKAIRVK